MEILRGLIECLICICIYAFICLVFDMEFNIGIALAIYFAIDTFKILF